MHPPNSEARVFDFRARDSGRAGGGWKWTEWGADLPTIKSCPCLLSGDEPQDYTIGSHRTRKLFFVEAHGLEPITVPGVVAYPQNASAIRWLIAHGEELRVAFKENHRRPGDLVHSLAVLVPPMTTEADFTPGADPDYVYVHVSIHGDPGHLEKTLEDFRHSLAQVGAPVADLEIVTDSE